jgi:hypothetical protein
MSKWLDRARRMIEEGRRHGAAITDESADEKPLVPGKLPVKTDETPLGSAPSGSYRTDETDITLDQLVPAVMAVGQAPRSDVLMTRYDSSDRTSPGGFSASELDGHTVITDAQYLPLEAALQVVPEQIGEISSDAVSSDSGVERVELGARRPAMPAEWRELRSLIDILFGPCAENERDQVFEMAVQFPDGALDHFRRLALGKGIDLDYVRRLDNRRTCQECCNLAHDGSCRAAARGELPGASSAYRPIPDVQHRCMQYVPARGRQGQSEKPFEALFMRISEQGKRGHDA